MQRVTASQSAFSNVIGEPGHTEDRPRNYATAQGTSALFVYVRFLIYVQQGCERFEVQVI
jgi:hypothetical protein